MDSLAYELIQNITKYADFKVRYINKSFNKATKLKAANMIHRAFKGHIKKLEDARKHPKIFKRHNLKNMYKTSPNNKTKLLLARKQSRYVIRKYVSTIMPYYAISLPEPNLKLSIYLLNCFRLNSEIKIKHKDNRVYASTMLHAVRNYRDFLMDMPMSMLLNEIHL